MNSRQNKGNDGLTYLSAYAIACKRGYTGTEQEWLASLKGDKGTGVELRFDDTAEAIQQRDTEGGDWLDLMTVTQLRTDVENATLAFVQQAKATTENALQLSTAAADAAQTAEKSAGAAAVSAETNMQTAETACAAAQQAAVQAEGSADLAAQHAGAATEAKSWAIGGTGSRLGEDTNNAKFWSLQAQGAAGGGVGSFNGRSGVVLPQRGDYTAQMVGAVAETRRINGKPLDGDITLTYTDTGADASGTAQAAVAQHATNLNLHTTGEEKARWNSKLDASLIAISEMPAASGDATSLPDGCLLFIREE